MSIRTVFAACVLLIGRAVLAHDTPLSPSTCVLDGVGFDGSSGGGQPIVAPPGSGDTLRAVYGIASSIVQFQPRQPALRPLTVAGEPGLVVLPAAFDATLDAAGDLRADHVAVEVGLAGGMVRIPLRLTTSLLALGGAVVAGTPVQPDGRFELVGAVPAELVPPALAGVTALRFGCRLQPAPDLDRFAPAPAVEALAGTLSARGGSLRGALRRVPGSDAFDTQPVLFEVRVNGARAALVEVPGGFTGPARRRIAEAPDGSRITLRSGARRRAARLRVRLATADLPSSLAGSADVRVSLVSGGVTARGAATWRARGGALRAGS